MCACTGGFDSDVTAIYAACHGVALRDLMLGTRMTVCYAAAVLDYGACEPTTNLGGSSNCQSPTHPSCSSLRIKRSNSASAKRRRQQFCSPPLTAQTVMRVWGTARDWQIRLATRLGQLATRRHRGAVKAFRTAPRAVVLSTAHCTGDFRVFCVKALSSLRHFASTAEEHSEW